MELYVSEDVKDVKTRFLELIFSYLKISERKLGKIVRVSSSAKDILKIETTPLLIKENDKIIGNEIDIAKYIATQCGLLPLFFGNTNEEKEKIEKFINHIIKDLQYKNEDLAKELNQSLLYETFIGGFLSLTVCDLLAYAIVAFDLNKYPNEKKNEFCNLLRWADHIQNLKGIKEITKDLKIWFTIPYEPFVLHDISDKGNKKDKKDKKKGKEEGEKTDKNDKTEKKEKPKKNEPAKEVHLMSKVDIRVGKIVNIFPNPEGDKLFNEEIDVGNNEIRTIASGLRNRVDINDLKDSLVVVICNLQPRNLKGWTSHGMILCASKDDKVEPLRPPQGSQPGDLVYIGDLPREPVPDKKTPWSKVCDDLIVNEKGQATYKNEIVWKTDKGDIIAPTLAGGHIS